MSKSKQIKINIDMKFKSVLVRTHIVFKQVIFCTVVYYTVNFDVLYHLKPNFRTVLNIKELFEIPQATLVASLRL